MHISQVPDIHTALFPTEAARYLGISTQALSRFRRQGRIHGERVGETNLYIYTLDDLRQADIKPRKRGRKPKK